MSGTRLIFLEPRALFLVVLAVGCPFNLAVAQTMDYGALEKTFGEPVTTSATGSPQRAADAPVDMVIVTADEIRRSGAHDIPGILRHVAGVDVAQWTNDNADVGIRGYNQPYSPRLLVLIDGRQVYADYYGFTPWSALPIELGAIRQIEIVKGPSSALFGFNAVGGVINIITYNPLYDEVNSASATVGTQGLAEGSAIATLYSDEKMALRATIGGRFNDDFGTLISPSIAGPQRRRDYRGEFSLRGVLRLGSNAQLQLEASHTVAALNEFYPAYTLDNAVYLTNSVKAQFTADSDIGLVSLTAYTNWIVERATATLAGVPLTLRLANQVTVTQLDDTFTLGPSNTFRLAAEYRHNEAGTVPFPGGNIFYDVYSGSAMWAWTISSSVSLTNAVRIENLSLGRSGNAPSGYPFVNANWNRNLVEYSFNSGLVWHLNEDDTLRLMASRGVQLPNLVNFGALLLTSPLLSLTGSPFANPTAVQNYELSWDRELNAINAKLHVSAFHQESDDILSNAGGQLFTQTGLWLTPGTIGRSSADGAEVTFDGSFIGGWRWGANYRLETVRDSFAPFAQNGINLVEFEHSTPRHLVNLNLGWSNDHWELDSYARYQSRTTGLVPDPSGATVQSPIPNYVSIDGRVGYRLDNGFTFALSGQNLALAKQQQTVAPAVERRVLFTVSTHL